MYGKPRYGRSRLLFLKADEDYDPDFYGMEPDSISSDTVLSKVLCSGTGDKAAYCLAGADS